MTNPRPTPKRFRPRFSIRTLVIVVTLICMFAACWGPTKRYGIPAVTKSLPIVSEQTLAHHDGITVAVIGHVYDEPSVLAPFVVSVRRYMNAYLDEDAVVLVPEEPDGSVFYFWFFGYVAKLPYEREIEVLQPRNAIYQ